MVVNSHTTFYADFFTVLTSPSRTSPRGVQDRRGPPSLQPGPRTGWWAGTGTGTGTGPGTSPGIGSTDGTGSDSNRGSRHGYDGESCAFALPRQPGSGADYESVRRPRRDMTSRVRHLHFSLTWQTGVSESNPTSERMPEPSATPRIPKVTSPPQGKGTGDTVAAVGTGGEVHTHGAGRHPGTHNASSAMTSTTTELPTSVPAVEGSTLTSTRRELPITE
ncbi:hypothetical protein CYMTET_18114 [Cymbomonas tetramitiformis]|uniref:Uncharacterized protein n=1 Tax=Cymbomonas tetramitiformis TaxID=36881 RepID=A0AAE0G8R1_9CHLO|nr:hypothetical protein CYMTET_18114 [Cymbomonas tetramitiformis]